MTPTQLIPTLSFSAPIIVGTEAGRITFKKVCILFAPRVRIRSCFSADISLKKAKTARFFDFPTGVIGSLSQPGGSLFGIEHSNGGLISFPGGVPVKNSAGEVIGAIGVSGSTVENDNLVAEAGANAL